jgi:putative membrane protein
MQDRIWWCEPWHMLISILFVGLIAALAIVLARKLWSEDSRQPNVDRSIDLLSSRATNLLDERYANGQIDREEYLQRRRDILGR